MSGKKKEESSSLYDGNASQRIAFEIIEGSEKFETAHNMKAVTDARLIEFYDACSFTFEGETTEERTAELARYRDQIAAEGKKLWRELVVNVENVECDGDFRDQIGDAEIEAVMNSLTNVYVVEPDAVSTGVRKLTTDGTVTIQTQSLLSGKLLTQKHIVRRRSTELEKRYDMIVSNDNTSISEKAKAKAKLYDDICVRTEGFKGKVPMRFKQQVVDYHFGTAIAAKK